MTACSSTASSITSSRVHPEAWKNESRCDWPVPASVVVNAVLPPVVDARSPPAESPISPAIYRPAESCATAVFSPSMLSCVAR
jgi:hypothetical protein